MKFEDLYIGAKLALKGKPAKPIIECARLADDLATFVWLNHYSDDVTVLNKQNIESNIWVMCEEEQ